jgi:hypothetical protein
MTLLSAAAVLLAPWIYYVTSFAKQNEEQATYWSWHATLLLCRGLHFITTFLLPWVTASPRIFCIITQRLQCRAELRLCYNLMNIQVATYFSFQHPSYLPASVFFHLSNLCCSRSTFCVTSHHASPLHKAVTFRVIMHYTGCEYFLESSDSRFSCIVFWSTILFVSPLLYIERYCLQ